MPTARTPQALGTSAAHVQHSSVLNITGDNPLNGRGSDAEASRRGEENEIQSGLAEIDGAQEREEHLPRGWTRMWSKTKNRPYYKYAAPLACLCSL